MALTKGGKLVATIVVAAAICGGGYYSYTHKAIKVPAIVEQVTPKEVAPIVEEKVVSKQIIQTDVLPVTKPKHVEHRRVSKKVGAIHRAPEYKENGVSTSDALDQLAGKDKL